MSINVQETNKQMVNMTKKSSTKWQQTVTADSDSRHMTAQPTLLNTQHASLNSQQCNHNTTNAAYTTSRLHSHTLTQTQTLALTLLYCT